MKKLFSSIAATLILAGSSTPVSSADPLWKFDGTQRLAVTHDGNGFDIDDVGASAFNWAIAWSFGAADKMCHFEHSNNLAGASATSGKTEQYQMMIESSEGGAKYFGLGEGTGYGTTGIVYDFIKDPDKTVAHFKLESDKNADTNRIVYIIAGQSESLYRELMATDPDKRTYVTCIKQNAWSEEFINHSTGMTHTWAACKTIPGGATFIDIRDQNAYLGSSKNNWNEIKTIGTKNGKTQADWDWLYIRQFMKMGDVSDAGIAYFVFTGNERGTGADLIARFNNPIGITSIVHSPIALNATPDNNMVRLNRTGTSLTVSLNGSQENGTVKVFNLMNRLVCTAPLSKGSAVVPVNSISRGSYVINIHAGNRKMVKNFINK